MTQSRDIRFRAWDKEEKEMLLSTHHNYWLLQGVDGITRYYELGSLYETDKYELMQYTGLKDKNGKEIYEGDILNNGAFGDGFEVEFSNDNEHSHGIGIVSGWLIGHLHEVEIIGNIYEDKEK